MTGMSMPRQEWYVGLPGYLRMWMTMMVPMMLPSRGIVGPCRRMVSAGMDSRRWSAWATS